MTGIVFGWEHPRAYVLRHWLFSCCWYRKAGIFQLRLLGFSLTLSRKRTPRASTEGEGSP